jgi:TetR/AcrR family transcriptional regulator, transcriptional repressor for nem operon
MARPKSFEEAAALEKAIELFWSQGYSGASMQDIVASLGLSRSSLYDTFGDKRQLFIAVLAQYQCQSEAYLRDLLTSEHDAKAGFQRLFDELVEKSLSDQLHKGCLMVNTATEMAAQDEEIAAIVQKNLRIQEGIYAEAIARGQSAGQINTAFPAESLARILTNTVLGVRVRVRLGTSRAELQEIVAMTMSLL